MRRGKELVILPHNDMALFGLWDSILLLTFLVLGLAFWGGQQSQLFKWVVLRKGDGGLYKVPTKEERIKPKAKRIARSDQVY